MGLIENSLSVRIAGVSIKFFVISFLLYTVISFFAVPLLVKQQLEQHITATERTVDVGHIRYNPLALSLDIHQLNIYDRRQQPQIGFERLYINFQSSSLLWLTFVFDKVLLDGFYNHYSIHQDGSSNIDDLLALLDTPAAQPNQQEDAETAIPRVLIRQLELGNIAVSYRDEHRQPTFFKSFGPIDLSLQHFNTFPSDESPYRLAAQTKGGESLDWQGSVSIVPLASSGSLKIGGVQLRDGWDFMQQQLQFEVTRGTARFKADYQFDDNLLINNGFFIIDDLAIVDKKTQSPALSFKQFGVNNMALDLNQQRLDIASVNSHQGAINETIDRQQQSYLQQLFTLISDTNEEQPDSGQPATPWQVNIGDFAFDDYHISLIEQTSGTDILLELSPLSLHANNFDLTKFQLESIELKSLLAVNKRADKSALTLATPLLQLSPLNSVWHFEISELPLDIAQPFIAPVANLELLSGLLHSNIDLSLNESDQQLNIVVDGSADIHNFMVKDTVKHKEFVSWDLLTVDQFNLDLSNNALTVNNVDTDGFFARIIINKDGTTNIQDSIKHSAAGNTADSHNDQPADPMAIEINSIRFANAQSRFADLSLSRRFAMTIAELNGSIDNISSTPGSLAKVNIQGSVNKYAPVILAGVVNPFDAESHTNLSLDFNGLELTNLTPYADAYAGYVIDKGKLTVNLDYKLEDNHIVGDNHFFLDQLTLGEKTESSTATTLPIALGIALLKDGNGEIDVDLAVEGNLDDPEFDYGTLVWDSLLTFMTKVVSSPFSMLSGLVDSEQPLNQIPFDFGTADLGNQNNATLNSLAEALKQRPQLDIEIRSNANSRGDTTALALQQLEPLLADIQPDDEYAVSPFWQQAYPYFEQQSGQDIDDIRNQMTDQAEQNGTPPNEAAIDQQVHQHIEQYLVEQQQIDTHTLNQLALQRSNNIRLALIDYGIEHDRIFVLDSTTTADLAEQSITELKLNAK
ncbi:hypothetical protein SIN8267_01813 [Sinobacterium norvegicum]|uniref:DUF748 domain-containing protein n=1 Tax=Sinobacterium norvegicum TaxID=1641715 RepID=A0ABM9AFG1_9GAMM|nr:DUF748 domain-containing protein [Sinobacterium norvegicum]CAH0991699.1 hypothetical protein SIN8267_01813 [Sinobacterium norvegicum]